jgi:hypothetical protein
MNDYAAGESYLATDGAGGTLILRWMDDIWAFGDVDPHEGGVPNERMTPVTHAASAGFSSSCLLRIPHTALHSGPRPTSASSP